MLNIAIVGTGIIASTHIDAIKQSDRCRVCALCDINEEAVKPMAEELGVPYFLDYKEIPDAVKPDAVIINLPHFLHCESTIFFLEHGIHVLVEKPMANTVEECDRMIAAAKKNNKKLVVGQVQRYSPLFKNIKNIIASGELGKLCMFTEYRTLNYFSPSRPKWFTCKEKSGGGVAMNFGAHALDKLFCVRDRTDVSVVSSCSNMANDADVEGHVQFLVRYPDGVSGAVTLSGYAPSGGEVTFYFTKGALKIANLIEFYRTNEKGAWELISNKKDTEEIFLNQITEFCKYVNDEPADVSTAEYGRSIISVIEKIYKDNNC